MPFKKDVNYYEILEVGHGASVKEIKSAYRKLALQWHPDKQTPEKQETAKQKFQIIGEAYEVLSNEGQRRASIPKLKIMKVILRF